MLFSLLRSTRLAETRLRPLGLLLAAASLLFLGLPGVGLQAEEPAIDFNRDIRPLLSKHCLNCHGPDEETREAELRLDNREAAIAESPSGMHAIVPGDAQASELFYRVSTDDESLRMPPAGVGKPLTSDEQKLLQRWIEAGASYAEHWAFVPPEKVEPPEVQAATANGKPLELSPIDRFVVQRLQQRGLQLEPAADREILIRRVALDVTGLPPTWEEVTGYLQDERPDATPRMIDRYLASPAFGERWAAVWLDLARYADSQGYAQDPLRTIWRYRDWVIQSYNANQPFDEFTVDQLAGDLLDNPRDDQILATAFHRNTMTNSEGGTDDEEFRSAAVVDRVNTTMQVWMGMTFGCAQCHTHKYDPITQTEYYQLFDVFNQTADTDHPSDRPHLPSYSAQRAAERARLQAEIARLEQEQTTREADTPAVRKLPAEGPLPARFVRVQSLDQNAFLHLAEVQVFRGGENVAVQGTASQISTAFGGAATRAIDGNTDGDYARAKSTSHTAQADQPWWEVDLKRAGPIERIAIWNRTDNPAVRDRLHRYRVIVLDDERRPLWVAEGNMPPQPSATWQLPGSFAEYDAELRQQVLALRQETEGVSPQLQQLRERLAKLTPDVLTPIMQELPVEQQRQTFVHIRGNFRQRGAAVSAGVPGVFPQPPADVELNRLSLARWLVDRRNPLTARVLVNRYWEQLFGRGLVETSEDFGTQGELPTHPQLLDWLAVDVMEHGWDRKRLLRTILNSRVYQQSSRVTAAKRESDPHNEWLSRGPRFRLPAEMVRDQALAVAGLLSDKMLGPSVRPPRPQLGLRAAFGGSTDWQTSPGEDRYRRGLYTQIRRTTPYPSFMTFDATSREVCTIRRVRTNTPLQALVTLNDPVYVEAAQGLARRVLQTEDIEEKLAKLNQAHSLQPVSVEPAKTAARLEQLDVLRCRLMFRLALIRQPRAAEVDVLLQLLKTARGRFVNAPDEAVQFATEPRGPLPAELDPQEAAAWTLLANAILNLDETLARP